MTAQPEAADAAIAEFATGTLTAWMPVALGALGLVFGLIVAISEVVEGHIPGAVLGCVVAGVFLGVFIQQGVLPCAFLQTDGRTLRWSGPFSHGEWQVRGIVEVAPTRSSGLVVIKNTDGDRLFIHPYKGVTEFISAMQPPCEPSLGRNERFFRKWPGTTCFRWRSQWR
ncbi:MAG: hypothetical protein ACLP2J_12690 [Acidimicrobiales bacterium]|jgi:hypothetical protein